MGVFIMAKPIGDTPVLEGDEATEFLNRMLNPPTKKQKELNKKNERTKICSFLKSYFF